MHKEMTELFQSKHDDDSMKYYKEELNKKCSKIGDRMAQLEQGIHAFVELHNFHAKNETQSLKMKKRESDNKLSKSQLSTVDPLLGNPPQTYEEEHKCLEKKLKQLKQKYSLISTNLKQEKPDAFVQEKENIYKRIEEATQIAKANKKKVAETQSSLSKVFQCIIPRPLKRSRINSPRIVQTKFMISRLIS